MYVALGRWAGAPIAVLAGHLRGKDGTMSTLDSLFPLDEADFKPVEDALQAAYDEIEDLARSLKEVANRYYDGEIPSSLPSYADVGHLYLFARHVKHVSTSQIAERAQEILDVLTAYDDIMTRPQIEATRHA